VACASNTGRPSTGTPVINGTEDYQPGKTDTASGKPIDNIGSKTYTMDIKGFAFANTELKIKKGDTIIWTNQDSVGHTVTSDSGSELDSPMIAKGETYSHTFNTVGTFNYHCTPHPNMKAKVIVE
jgi:amicyanin